MDNNLTDGYREQGARKALADELRKKGIEDENVLKAIAKVPRHFFFEKTFQNQAYKDIAFQIGEGQTISQPFTVAYQTQLLHIHKGDKVLEIGTGSGYQTCILAELGATVITIERIKTLQDKARSILPKMGYRAVYIHGDGSRGAAHRAPFDKIIVTAGAPWVPEDLLNQLKVGGILVIPVGDQNTQKMMTVLKTSETTHEKIELDTFRFVPLVGDKAW